MAKGKKKSKFDNKFKSTLPKEDRRVNVLNERKVQEEPEKLSFNFKDFDESQCPPGQKLDDWEKDKRLSKLIKKFIDISQYNIIEAQQKSLLKIYGQFPKNSKFSVPKFIQGEVQWGTIQRIGGQKPRLAGYIIGSVFYPVFLDRDHLFFPKKK